MRKPLWKAKWKSMTNKVIPLIPIPLGAEKGFFSPYSKKRESPLTRISLAMPTFLKARGKKNKTKTKPVIFSPFFGKKERGDMLD